MLGCGGGGAECRDAGIGREDVEPERNLAGRFIAPSQQAAPPNSSSAVNQEVCGIATVKRDSEVLICIPLLTRDTIPARLQPSLGLV